MFLYNTKVPFQLETLPGHEGMCMKCVASHISKFKGGTFLAQIRRHCHFFMLEVLKCWQLSYFHINEVQTADA